MLTRPTAERLRSLGLAAMADACTGPQSTPEAADLPREDWLGPLADREATSRDNKRLARRLRDAKPRQAATVEDTVLPHAPRPGPRAVPEARRLRLPAAVGRTRRLVIDDWGPAQFATRIRWGRSPPSSGATCWRSSTTATTRDHC